MAFKQKGTLTPYGAPVLRREILANSITVSVNDSVKAASGFVALGTAGALVLGHVVGIGTDKGVGLNSTGIAGAEMGSFAGTYLTASNNQTVGKVRAEIDLSLNTLYSAGLDATIASTTGSNLLGYNMDLASAKLLDEDTATTGTAQYNSFGVDLENSANAVVHILESQVFGA